MEETSQRRKVTVVGLGYVGLSIAMAFVEGQRGADERSLRKDYRANV